ncbi:TetR/AcrR family transcriptional regulator [Eisenibacter elegans]|jgi:TetR/AcrR family transcriptional repressor of nem operon|uniref:TetR/AcrR family transcriptional regulator n=1 Tax=Eisenibacter elegans TaxID=997 RepID=UPI0004026146|nr:TetR/AcrR family transcriptional regulator [Eisenibacter elegans]
MDTAKITTKESLIQKAALTFNQQGYHHTSIADLAKACEVKASLFYYYFENKEALMQAVLEYVFEMSVKRLRLLAQNPELTPQEKLAKVTKFMEKLYLNTEGGCIMANTTLETALAAPVYLDTLKAFFEEWIAAYQLIYQSQYQPDKARELAEATVQDIEGGIMLTKLYQDKKYLLNALKRSERLLG